MFLIEIKMAVTKKPYFETGIENYQLTFSEDLDEIILPTSKFSTITVQTVGITGDEIKVFESLDKVNFQQNLDANGLNPFDKDYASSMKNANISYLKIVRAGALDGVITVYLKLKK